MLVAPSRRPITARSVVAPLKWAIPGSVFHRRLKRTTVYIRPAASSQVCATVLPLKAVCIGATHQLDKTSASVCP
jgi:hypothetical protein